MNLLFLIRLCFFFSTGDVDSLSAGNAGNCLHMKCLLILAAFLLHRIAYCDQLTDMKT